jgi:hypothetical protein
MYIIANGCSRFRNRCRFRAKNGPTTFSSYHTHIGSREPAPFDKVRQVDQGAIADYKRLGSVLAMIRDEQLRRGPERRSGPRRRDQRDARLFKVG